MRIESGNSNFGFSAHHTKSNPSSLVFKFNLEEQQQKINEEKKEEKTGQLITSREGGYVRQYIVRSDGTRILVSEIKQENDETTPTENYMDTLSFARLQNDRIHQNTEQMISLLNYQAGIVSKNNNK
ncbi:MAG TPA: hypothetical protein VGI33_03090 [Paenibacillus sp.]|jgi:hypothetical protein